MRYTLFGMDKQAGRRVCELILGIIASDQELHPAEYQFMLKTFQKFGVAQSGDDEVVAPTVGRFEAAKAMKALPEDVRSQAIDLLVESAAADGKVVDAERDYLYAVAAAIDMSTEAIDDKLKQALADSSAG